MSVVSRTELEWRLRSLREAWDRLPEPPDGLVLVQKADVYWLAGTTQDLHLLVPREGEPRLLVRKVFERARDETSILDARPMASLRELPEHCRELFGSGARIGLELDVLSFAQVSTYRKVLAGHEIVDGSAPVLDARSRKSEAEIAELRAAASLHERLFADVPEILASETTTFGVQTALEKRAADLGHCGLIRMRGLDVTCGIGIVVSGEDGAVPSHSMFPIGGAGPHPWVAAGGSRRPIERDTPIILDYLMSRTGYHADATRMAVVGAWPDEAEEILAGVLRVLRHIERLLLPGALPSAIYAEAVEVAEDAGLGAGFMGPEPYRVRFVGHGVGLEVNERPVLAPRFDAPLEVGNAIAVEPKFTHPRFGVIGLENTYVVRDGAPEKITTISEDVILRP